MVRMLRSLSVRSRLIASLVALTIAALSIMAFQYVTTTRLLADLSADEARSVAAAQTYARLAEAYRDQETGVRGYLLTHSVEFLEPYDAGRLAEPGLIVALLLASSERPSSAGAIEAVRTAAAEWQHRYAMPALIAVAAGESPTSIQSLRDGKALFDTLRLRLGELEAAVNDPNDQIEADVNEIIQLRLGLLVLLAGLLLIAIIVNARYVNRWIVLPLSRLVATARLVESGADVPFSVERADEIGDLGSALERMRRRLLSEQEQSRVSAAHSDVVNRFTELSAFLQTDAKVAGAVLDALAELIGPDRGVVHIANRSRDRAFPEAAFGDALAEQLALKTLDECPGVRRGALYVSADLDAPLAVHCAVMLTDRGTVACIPLIALGETVGAAHIAWDAPRALPLEQRPAVARIAEHSALSIANRRLVQALQGMATTDARTGLANSRAFDEALADALSAAPRDGGSPVSVLMLDMDDFKRFNDRYGHPAGDEALRVFARILSGSLREGDMAARYGGEEFAVLLPGLDLEGARLVAERIRSRTESTIIALGPGQSGRVTVSIGVGSAPQDGHDGPSLLRTIDAALYRAKTGGRNRVIATGDQPGEAPDEFVAIA